jgi:hypothetical protein
MVARRYTSIISSWDIPKQLPPKQGGFFMAMNGNEGGSAYPPNPDVKSGSCLIAGFQPLTVVHPSYWNAYKTESGATFSIDMVRLKLSFINGKGEWLSTHAQTFDCDSMSAWTSKIRPGGWYELWSFDLGDSSVALGIGFMEPRPRCAAEDVSRTG